MLSKRKYENLLSENALMSPRVTAIGLNLFLIVTCKDLFGNSISHERFKDWPKILLTNAKYMTLL